MKSVGGNISDYIFRGVWGHAPQFCALRQLLVQFEALSCSTFVADIAACMKKTFLHFRVQTCPKSWGGAVSLPCPLSPTPTPLAGFTH